MSTGTFPESLSQQILVGRILVGRLGVAGDFATRSPEISSAAAEVRAPGRPDIMREGSGRDSCALLSIVLISFVYHFFSFFKEKKGYGLEGGGGDREGGEAAEGADIICMYLSLSIYIYIYIHVYIYIYMYIYMHIIYVCVCLYVRTYVCMYVCM